MRKRVYIAGPISKGDRAKNVRSAMDVALELVRGGYAPLCPHLTNYLDPTDKLGQETWYEVDLPWVAVSQLVVRLPGESVGADKETAYAEQLGIPVVTMEDLRVKQGVLL